MDDNGKPINKIGVWTKKGFIETPIEQLLSSKNKTTKNERK